MVSKAESEEMSTSCWELGTRVCLGADSAGKMIPSSKTVRV